MKAIVKSQVERLKSGEVVFCPSCKKNKPLNDFKDSSLVSGVGRKCLDCKTSPTKQKQKKTKTSSPRKTWKGQTCRVCLTPLIQGENWAESRVKRYDYICSSCKGKKKTKTKKNTLTKSPQTTPDCPKCGSKLVKRYSKRYSKYFWGCSKFPACRGARNI